RTSRPNTQQIFWTFSSAASGGFLHDASSGYITRSPTAAATGVLHGVSDPAGGGERHSPPEPVERGDRVAPRRSAKSLRLSSCGHLRTTATGCCVSSGTPSGDDVLPSLTEVWPHDKCPEHEQAFPAGKYW